jgi:prenyltransferase beta subunit
MGWQEGKKLHERWFAAAKDWPLPSKKGLARLASAEIALSERFQVCFSTERGSMVRFTSGILLGCSAFLFGCEQSDSQPRAAQIGDPVSARPMMPLHTVSASAHDDDERRTRGASFLVKLQSEDGAWRSTLYSTLQDGTTLTGLVLRSLQSSIGEHESHEVRRAREKASAWLASFAQEDETIQEPKGGFAYPVYTAALSVITLSHPSNEQYTPAARAWLRYLLDRQLTEQNGWKPSDKDYGGWGYYPGIPRKAGKDTDPAQKLLESNLTVTRFALEAIVGRTIDPELLATVEERQACRAAEVFLMRCQDADGGFRFSNSKSHPTGLMNPNAEMDRFHSYGNATAESVLCQLIMGSRLRMDLHNPESQQQSLNWLIDQFSYHRHPNDSLPKLDYFRSSPLSDHTASTKCVLNAPKQNTIGGQRWADQIRKPLRRQQPDDCFGILLLADPQENKPILATDYVTSTLVSCRKAKS